MTRSPTTDGSIPPLIAARITSPAAAYSSGSGAHAGRLRPDSWMRVRMNPGHNPDTPTGEPAARRSAYNVSEIVTTACFVALYGPRNGGDVSPATDAVLTTWPSPCSTRRGTNTRIPCTTPHRLTPRIQRQSASGTVQIGPPVPTPALLWRRCTAP